jgi:hypothetical protein
LNPVKELDNNILGMGAVKMLEPSDVSKNIRYEALNYLMFLKRKRCGKVNRIPVMVPLTAPLLGGHFLRGISPSKNGPIAPY